MRIEVPFSRLELLLRKNGQFQSGEVFTVISKKHLQGWLEIIRNIGFVTVQISKTRSSFPFEISFKNKILNQTYQYKE